VQYHELVVVHALFQVALLSVVVRGLLVVVRP
jgi:hypothetical protein